MNIPAPATATHQEKLKAKLKHSSLRAIDQGTRYDIGGGLRRLARSIESGELGNVGNVVVGISSRELDGVRGVSTVAYGVDSISEKNYTVAMMAARMTRPI